MTVERKQLILAWCGLIKPAEVDGIWGPQSAEATRKLQKALGLQQDGVFGDATVAEVWNAVFHGRALVFKEERIEESAGADWWKKIRYFSRNEPRIACPCGRCGGFPVEPVERLMLNADATREHFGRPMIPSSTVRCAAHNASLKGSAANSLHMRGKAMDFAIPGVKASTIVAYVKTLPEVDECYAIDADYVHMGVQEY